MRALTYCGNIHAGETWADVRGNLAAHTLAVKQALSPRQSFPLGLRLSAQAAFELNAVEIQHFREWCETEGCHVLTLNGFPYGAFHGTAVKAEVYQPDWRDGRRAQYTKRLADILAQWTPRERSSSISTVPIAFRNGFHESHWPAVRTNLVDTLTHLANIHDRGGPLIRLALEPEPCCVLEQISEVVRFFECIRLPAVLADYVGICFDCCHQAVEFEDPASCLKELAQAGIRIVKVQVSSALRASGDEIPALLQFDEPTYLHQTMLRTADDRLLRFADLPELARWLRHGEPVVECRVHFHVPIFLAHLETVGTTRFFLEECLPLLDAEIPLEVETYSFGVLPPQWRLDSVSESVIRELKWVRDNLHASHGRH